MQSTTLKWKVLIRELYNWVSVKWWWSFVLRFTSRILTFAYTIWIPSYTRCALVHFSNSSTSTILLKAFTWNKYSYGLSPFTPHSAQGSSGQVPGTGTNPQQCWAREPGHHHSIHLLSSKPSWTFPLFLTMIKEVMSKAICLTNSTEFEDTICTDRKKYLLLFHHYRKFYQCN